MTPNTVQGRKSWHSSLLPVRKLRLKGNAMIRPTSSYNKNPNHQISTPPTLCPRGLIFMVKLEQFFYQQLSYLLAGPCRWTLMASEDSGLNPGKMKQIFNSHIHGGFSTSNTRQEKVPPGLLLLLRFPPQLLSLLSHDHALWFMVAFRSYRGTKVASDPTQHPGPGQQSKIRLGAFAHSIFGRSPIT